jgi:hypothetical protein
MANEDDRMVQALTQRADQLDSEATTGENEGQPVQAPDVTALTRHPAVLRLISAEFRALAEHIRAMGHKGATIYGDEPPAEGTGLQVEKMDVDPTPASNAGQASSSPRSGQDQTSQDGPASDAEAGKSR